MTKFSKFVHKSIMIIFPRFTEVLILASLSDVKNFLILILIEECNFTLYPQFCKLSTYILPALKTFCIETLQLNMLHNVL